MKLPFTEMGKNEKGASSDREIMNLVLEVSSLRCLLDIYECVSLRFRKVPMAEDIY